MSQEVPNPENTKQARVLELVRTLRAAERELQELTNGELDFVASESGEPYLLREAQEKLIRSEAAQRQLAETQVAILNALPAHVALINSTGVIISVNEAWRRVATANALQGPAFAIGQNYLDCCERATGDCAEEAIAAAQGIRGVLRGAARDFAMEYACHSPGEKRWFRLTATPLNEGESRGAVVMHVNITERKLAEEAIRASEEQFSSAFENAAIGMALVSPEGHWMKVNQALCDLFGYPAEELVRRTFQEITHPDDLGADLENVRRLLAGEIRSYCKEKRYFHKKGHLLWAFLSVSLIRDPDGKPVHFISQIQDITERKKAEESLLKNEALLRIASRVARLGGWTIELPEYILTWSDETCLIHDFPRGYKPSFAEGVQYFPLEHRAQVMRAVESCVTDGTPYDFEVPKNTAAGRRIWVRCIGEAVRNAEGKIIRLQGAFQDITERKQSELELARLNRALRLLSSINEVLIHATEEKPLLTHVCRLAVELGGYRMAWVGYAVQDERCSIAPAAHAGHEDGYLSKIQLTWSDKEPSGRGPGGKTIREGQPIICKDVFDDSANVVWREEALDRGYRSMVCLPLRHGKTTFGLLALYGGEVNDAGADEIKLLQELADDLAFGIINVRAREERRIAQQEIEQQAELLNKATDAIFVRDLDDRITYWSQGAERIYGWRASEMIGQSFLDKNIRPTDAANAAVFRQATEHLLATGEWSGELQKVSKSGRQMTVEARWTLLRDEQERPKAVLIIDTDITEKKKMEAQFLRAQRMESIGTLAGGIAHDLNNVLAPILMAVDMLRSFVRDQEGQQVLNMLHGSAQRGAELVGQVLSFARGVEGKRISVNPLHILRDISKIVRDTFPKNIQFTLIPPRDLWVVTGDPTQLHQVLMNLSVNARDAMPNGGRLSVTLENVVIDEVFASMNPESKPGAYVMINVADTGMGIPAGLLDKIFEPFFTTKEFGKGTGLGLSTTLAIVKSHGGFIKVCSERGKGSEFKVYLPANPDEAALDKAAPDQAHSPRGNGELVLVVDDEEAVRVVASKTLECFGYRALVACHGAEAVALYAQHQNEISAVLTDMAMPIMDGPALIVALRRMNPAVRVIGSSGLTSRDGISQALGSGIVHFVPKPYTAEVMLSVLRKALDN
jgi:PAS domain S-box-containing protein